MTHEVIEIESKDADLVHILTGTVTDIDTENIKVDVDIDDYGSFADVPVFYHCENSETADGMPFLGGERVIIVNSGDAVNLSVANMKVIGFEDGLPRSCPFYIDVTVNGKTPEHTKTLKIIDKNDNEHLASSTEEEPWKVGPFQDIAWPAKIYLYYTGGAGVIFSYFKTPGTTGYLVAKETHTDYCKEEWGRSKLIGHFYSGGYTPIGDEEFILSAERVEYLLHGTFDSKPTSPLAFTTKLLGKLQVKSSGFNFVESGCSNCQPVSTTKSWESDSDSIVYPAWIGAYSDFPNSCRASWVGPFFCSETIACGAAAQWDSFNECTINNMAIMTDENGHSPVFENVSVSVSFVAHDVWCQETDENGDWVSDICYELSVELLEAQKYEWKMLPTPDDRI